MKQKEEEEETKKQKTLKEWNTNTAAYFVQNPCSYLQEAIITLHKFLAFESEIENSSISQETPQAAADLPSNTVLATLTVGRTPHRPPLNRWKRCSA